jgi:tetratricopeptide (TPR) repeat protein
MRQPRRSTGNLSPLLVGLLTLGLSLVPAFLECQERPEPYGSLARYRRIVERYRGGDVDGAIEELLAFRRAMAAHDEESARSTRLLPELADPDAIKAAALLHAEIVIRDLVELPSESSWHLGTGTRLIEHPAVPLSFRGGWYLALAWKRQESLDLDQLAADIPLLTQRFSFIAETWLTVGSWCELLAWPKLAGLTGGARRWAGRRTSESLSHEAEQAFRRALAVSPGLAEARLRLARVLHELGRNDEALGTLSPLLERGSDPWVSYLARLFAGAACERLGRPAEAAAHYSVAVAIGPACQSARVALSHALRRAGDRTGSVVAAAEVARLRPVPGGDPWWDYRYGQARRLPERLLELRREVMR